MWLRENMFRNSHGMDGVDDETITDRGRQRQQTWLCQQQHSATGAVNALKALLDDVMIISNQQKCWWMAIKHAFITWKHPLALPQIYLHMIPSRLDTKEAKIERYNRCTLCWTCQSAYLQEVKWKSNHYSSLRLRSDGDSVKQLKQNSVNSNDSGLLATELLGCVSYMSSHCPAGPRSLTRLGILQWQTHHRACLPPSSQGHELFRHCSEWPVNDSTNTLRGKLLG